LKNIADIDNLSIDLGDPARRTASSISYPYELQLVAYNAEGDKIGESKTKFKGGSLPLGKSLRKCCKSLEDVVKIHATVTGGGGTGKASSKSAGHGAREQGGLAASSSETFVFQLAR